MSRLAHRAAVVGAIAALTSATVAFAGEIRVQCYSDGNECEVTQDLAKRVPITGTAKNGKKFKGTFTINRFAKRGGALYAVGTLKGRLKHRHVTRRGVRIPAELTGGAQAAQIPPTPGACQILNLTLLPPDIQQEILLLDTTDVRNHRLFEKTARGATAPADWNEQRSVWRTSHCL